MELVGVLDGAAEGSKGVRVDTGDAMGQLGEVGG
jgi:hypothetical protein